jgi:hypothetical protein
MTELTWDGKYDDQGRKVAPPRIALPFQTVETVNESAADRDWMQDLFASGRPTDWRNRLIWGDKKYVLPSLLEEFAGKVNLIYIDPPFATGGDFSYTATIPDDPDTEGDQSTSFTKEPSVIEQKAYRDTWGRGLDGYLKWFYEGIITLRDLLSDTGSVYVHLDFNVCHYAKGILDEVFGTDRFRNEVVWSGHGPSLSLSPFSAGSDRDADLPLRGGAGPTAEDAARDVRPARGHPVAPIRRLRALLPQDGHRQRQDEGDLARGRVAVLERGDGGTG